ncbi:hypothetical protein [Nitratireductor rhodophyticola]|uniref:hypothetical protein n=1 Tax=Nitratireductor rhodophyticola TaxID=2854036 RepID=UPI00300A20C1
MGSNWSGRSVYPPTSFDYRSAGNGRACWTPRVDLPNQDTNPLPVRNVIAFKRLLELRFWLAAF